MAEKKAKLSFEDNIKELESIVKTLESGEATLEEMLGLFEEGVRRTKECRSQLLKAEQKISVLMESPEGGIEEKPFDAPLA